VSTPATGRPDQRTIVLIGATSGIGRMAARQLAAQGHRLILVGRDRRRGQALAAELAKGPAARTRPPAVFIAGDVATHDGVAAVVREIREHTDHVDTLINNAGVMLPRRQVTGEGMEYNFAVHHLAPYTMTALLLPLLERGDGRIVNTNSEGHRTTMSGAGGIDLDFSDLQSERHYSMFLTYSRTKLANLLFTYEFHRRFPQLTIVAVHPGMVRTRLMRGARNPALWLLNKVGRVLLMRPSQGAAPIVHLATAPYVESGSYYNRFVPAGSSPESMSRQTARRLWEVTERLRGPMAGSTARG
jgi:NAD(P)-dependent dehydrogenase (short-subunit alcohol dehydrogenase family)